MSVRKNRLAESELRIIERRKLTQAKAGKILGIDTSDISRLKAGDFNPFSVERLFTLLNRFNRNIEIRITPAIGWSINGSLRFRGV